MLNSAVVFCSADLSKLLRVRHSVIALNAYTTGGAGTKRVQSATKSTPAGHASAGAVAFCGEADELQLKPSAPSGIVRRHDDGDVQNVVASANVHAHASGNHCDFVCTDESHGKAVCVRSCVRAVAAENRCAKGKLRPTKTCPAVCDREESLRMNSPLLILPTVSFIWASLSSPCFNFRKIEF